MHQIRTLLSKQGLLGEVSTKSATCQHDRPMLLKLHATILINQANAGAIVHQQRGGTSLGDDPGFVGFFLRSF